MIPFQVSRPFELVGCDLMGSFKETESVYLQPQIILQSGLRRSQLRLSQPKRNVLKSCCTDMEQ